MVGHDFIDREAPPNVYRYNLVFIQATREIITLPAPTLFDVHARGKYIIMPENVINYKNALAAAEEIHPWDAQVPQPTQYVSGPA